MHVALPATLDPRKIDPQSGQGVARCPWHSALKVFAELFYFTIGIPLRQRSWRSSSGNLVAPEPFAKPHRETHAKPTL